ncbi:winged helix DNA-binding protein [Frankia sp. CNm7]|uniref:Winged helix DNA-binding protein n=1 Tax=Frankia nepalensis TaxID=1836974 RepID=A0A937RBQ3_9ACTN|nr:winged helix DNA-binding protein [Frankia nepalensis]MBL7496527.1 winged helix DNA-binding protein [Frankia nepalensis]MBL7508746.1 winged helix DNA-binding protein [Frankia nepalensis]MBL7523791.1 winged helix DNA-binding protein [Frankia nepalensis]MBL7627500.1 winged helix DNA-binding protein [Frankia nepalensis]
MTTIASTVNPTVNGRVIALAHFAGRALLEGVLDRHGATFHQSVTLRAVVAAGESIGRDELVADVAGSLKTDESVVRGVIEELTAAKLLEEDPATTSRLRLTDAGRELYESTTTETAQISARLYAGIPADDLAIAGRVLALVTERANTELASA